jgi:outer membrane receptor for ferric coprogen and ferric-rhodotorulic acid
MPAIKWLLGAVALIPLPALAQQDPADPAREMARIAVVADDEASPSYSASPGSTATGLTLSLRETPQSITVITQERIADQAMTQVGDALRATPGVSLKPVDRGRNNLVARGFEVNNFQFDGSPVATGNVGLETMNSAIYDRIEVVRGATGLMSGAGDPSAAVNLVRKHAVSDTFDAAFSAELGSWDQRGATVDLATPLNSSGSMRARFIASHDERDAFIDLEHRESTIFYGIVDADLTDATRLSIGASLQRDRRDGVLWVGLPYWFSDGTRAVWERSKTSATKWNRWDTDDETYFASLAHEFENRWNVRVDASYHHQREDSMLLWMWGDPDATTGEGMEAYPYHYLAKPRQTHFSITSSGPFTLFGRQHQLTFGVMNSRLEDGWLNRDALDDVPPVGDFAAWDGSYPEPAMGDFYVGSSGTTKQSAAYAATRVSLADAWNLIAGGRVTQWKRDERTAAWTPEGFRIEHSSVFTPYFGVVWDFAERLSAYASYTDSFKPQESRDRNGDFLDPLEGRSFEAGVKGEFVDGRLNASAAVFRIDQENFPVADPGFFVPGTNDPASRPAQGVEAEGYELEITGDLRPDWQMSLGWTHYTAKDADGLDVAVDHPRRQLKLFTKYRLPGALDALSIGGGINWESAKPATATNPVTGLLERVGQPSFALVDLMAKYELREQLSLQLNVNNLLDEKYRYGSYWWGAPYTYGEPRNVLLTLDYRL